MRGPRPAPARKTSSSENREATFLSSLISLSAWALGVGVLALPRAVALCGPRCGIAFLMTFALWVDLSLRWVVACGRCSGKSGFRENALFFFGQRAAQVVYIGQVLLLCGGMIAVYSTAASLLGCSAKELLDCLCHEEQEEEEKVPLASQSALDLPLRSLCRSAHPCECMPRNRVLVLVATIVFPLACQRSLHALTWISSLCLGFIVYFFSVLVWRLVDAGFAATAAVAATSPEILAAARVAMAAESGGAEGSFWQGPPIILMSLLCHTSILKLDGELRLEDRSRIGSVIDTVILRVALPMYAVVGLGGYWLRGPGVSPNILEDFPGDAWMAVARLSLGAASVAKLATATVTLREALVAEIPGSSPLGRALRLPLGRAAAVAALLSAGAAAASVLGSLARVLSLLGCTVGVLFSLCLPAALYAQLLRDIAHERRCNSSVATSTATDLERPLLAGPSSSGPLAAPLALAAAGVVRLPESPGGWLLQCFACASVFFGGILVGGLGLASWLSEFGA